MLISVKKGGGGRLDYIDAMRGFTMLLVIYCHLTGAVAAYCNVEDYLSTCIARIRMPLFFCISGFFAYAEYDLITFKKRIKNRFFLQLWPTVVVFLSFCLITGHSIITKIYDPWKAGYWFTYTLVMVFIPFSLLSFICNLLKVSKTFLNIFFSSFLISSLAINLLVDFYEYDILEYSISKILSLDKIILYTPYFYLGILIRLNFSKIRWIFESKIVLSILTITLVLTYFSNNCISRHSSAFIGIFLFMGIFFQSQQFWNSDNIIARLMKKVGKNTLPIYLYHFFITAYVYLTGVWLYFGDILGKYYIEIPIFIALSLIIAIVCIYADELLGKISILHKFIYGK